MRGSDVLKLVPFRSHLVPVHETSPLQPEACRHSGFPGSQSSLWARRQSDTPHFRFVHSVIATDAVW